MAPFTAHLAAIFSGPMAVDAVLTPQGGGAALPGRVMFDAPGSVVEGVMTQEPSALCQASAWPAAKPGDAIAINAQPYRLRSIEPQDDGATVRLVLARV